MGIRGLWQYIASTASDADKFHGKFDYIYIDATLLVIWLASPISHLKQEQFDLVFSRNLGNKIMGLRKFLKPTADIRKDHKNDRKDHKDHKDHKNKRIVFVLDPGKAPNNKIRPRMPVNIHPDSFTIFGQIIAGISDTMIITAPDEADHEIVRALSSAKKLNNESILVFSDDSDLVQYSKCILRFDLKSMFVVSNVLRALKVSRKQFIEACKIAANDYNESGHTFSVALKQVISMANKAKK